MIGSQDRWQEDIFVAGSLRNLIPEDHILRRVDRVLDLAWLRQEVADCYCADDGRPSIDPEAAVRLMLAGFFAGIVHDRKLMREAQVNLAMRWFAGYRLHDRLPDHSSLTRIRQRWGDEKFKHIFQRTVAACVKAGLVDGETVHIDATLVRADVSWESVVEMHTEQVLVENATAEGNDGQTTQSPGRESGRLRKHPPKVAKLSVTDLDATRATSSHDRKMEFCYKQHTAVDDKAGVIVDVAVTTGEVSEGTQLKEQIERVDANTGRKVTAVTADAGYAHPLNYERLEKDGIDAVIPPQREPKTAKRLPLRRFKYDARRQRVRCPGGRYLERSHEAENGWYYRARTSDCRSCPLRARCLSAKSRSRTVLIVHGYEALLRARRRKARRWDERTWELYRRHRWRVEGKHGEAKVQHGLRRAVRRGQANVAIQVYLTAAVMNLKCLVAGIIARHGPTEPKGPFGRLLQSITTAADRFLYLLGLRHDYVAVTAHETL
jgi:transposase